MTTEKENNKEFLDNFLAIQSLLILELQKCKETGNNSTQIQTLLNNVLKFEIKMERFASLLIGRYEEDMRQMCAIMTKYGSVPDGMNCMERPTDNVSLAEARWAFASSATANEDADE